MNKTLLFALTSVVLLACTVSTSATNMPNSAKSELKNERKQPTAANTAPVSYIVANCETVNVRECAGTACAGVAILPTGAEVVRVGPVATLADASTWYYVRALAVDAGGWVNSKYLEELK